MSVKFITYEEAGVEVFGSCRKCYLKDKAECHIRDCRGGIFLKVPDDPDTKQDQSALSSQVGGNHYKGMVIQPIEFCQKNRLGYAESLAIKYICRHGSKNGAQDIDKAIHCLQLLKELEYGKP